jgi:predicted transcriptional regulator
MMGSSSVSRYQAGARVGHLEHRFELPLSVATQTKVLTAPSDATVDELLTETFVTSRHTTVPIVDHGIYVGIVTLDDLRTVDREERRVTLARALVHDDAPRALPTWSVEQAIRAMSDAGRDLLPVVDIDGTFVGIVTTTDLLRLDEILAATDADGVPGVGDAT